jgi:hypothetical protein
MKRKNLYALTLLLFLSTVALSNESARFRCGTAGTTCTDPKCAAKAPVAGATAAKPAAIAAKPAATASKAPALEPAPTIAESHVLLHTFIKLLYI